MAERLIWQFLTLSIFSLLMGITFCDFYKLETPKKLVWFFVLFLISAYVLRAKGEYVLHLILPVPMLLAILLAWIKKNKQN